MLIININISISNKIINSDNSEFIGIQNNNNIKFI